MDDVQAVGWQPTVRHVGIAICTSRGRRRSAHTEPVAEAPSSPQGACGFAPLRHRLHELLPRAEPGPRGGTHTHISGSLWRQWSLPVPPTPRTSGNYRESLEPVAAPARGSPAPQIPGPPSTGPRGAGC